MDINSSLTEYLKKINDTQVSPSKNLHEHLFLLTERNPKSIFIFAGVGGEEAKIAFSLFCSTPSGTGHRQVPCPDIHSAPRCHSFERCCEHLCFTSMYFVHPLVRCIPRFQESPRGYSLGLRTLQNSYKLITLFFTPSERLHRITLLPDSQEKL